MPIQLPKIPCKICKELFKPTNSGHTMYCGNKCQYAAGNTRKKIRRECLRKNVEILRGLRIPRGQSKQITEDELKALSFKGGIYSKKESFWTEGMTEKSTKYYYDYFVISNQGGGLTIYELV